MSAPDRPHAVAALRDRYVLGYGHDESGEIRPVFDPRCGRLPRRRGEAREVELDACEIVELRPALGRVYATPALFAMYVVPGRARQPRITKGGLEHLLEAQSLAMPTISVFFADVDNAGHRPWRDATEERSVIESVGRLPVLAAAGLYATRAGYRIVQPLERAISVVDAEPWLASWIASLRAAGIPADESCRDWTRLFAVPHYTRIVRDAAGRCLGRQTFVSETFSFDRMTAISPPGPVPRARPSRPSARARPSAPLDPIAWTDEVPADWALRVPPLAAAIAREPESWHDLFLALAGAMLERGVTPELVPELSRAISAATRADTRSSDRVSSARTTVARWRRKEPVRGFSALASRWPAVATALELALGLSVPAPPPDAAEQLREALRRAPDGVTAVGAECGMGKTAAAIQVAHERASRRSKGDPDKIARVGTKTIISCSTNALALQIFGEMKARGVPVTRIFGPLSLMEDDGITPVCKLHEVAKHLVEGGLSIHWELCEGRKVQPCPHRDGCRAREGMEGDDEYRALIAPHALMKKANAGGGAATLFVIDEPPSVLETSHITTAEIAHAISELRALEGRYRTVMEPILRALIAWTPQSEVEGARTLADVMRELEASVTARDLASAQNAVELDPTATLVDCAKAAIDDDQPRCGPPLTLVYLSMLQHRPALAASIGRACKTIGTLHSCITSADPVSVRVLEGSGERVLALTFPNADLIEVLRREGSTAVLDAGVHVHLPAYEKILGYAPRYVEVRAPDGAPIARTQIQLRAASRKGWFEGGRLLVNDSLVSAVHAAIGWACEGANARTLAIITMRTIRIALEAALRPDDAEPERRWRDAGQPAAGLTGARERLGPILRRWPGEILFGHYGAVRGLNAMADADALITLGDPRPNLGDVWNEAAYLELADAQDRVNDLAAVELEQAHGRLRVVHRRRPGRALHVGMVLPGGTGWRTSVIDRRSLAGGRAPQGIAIAPEELRGLVDRAGGATLVAHALGVGGSALRNYLAGTRLVPAHVLAGVTRLAEIHA